jgi:hypothetical protein
VSISTALGFYHIGLGGSTDLRTARGWQSLASWPEEQKRSMIRKLFESALLNEQSGQELSAQYMKPCMAP